MEKIEQLADFLPRLDKQVDWEMFRYQLYKVRDKERKSTAGRKPYDVVFMFKMLVLQSLYPFTGQNWV